MTGITYPNPIHPLYISLAHTQSHTISLLFTLFLVQLPSLFSSHSSHSSMHTQSHTIARSTLNTRLLTLTQLCAYSSPPSSRCSLFSEAARTSFTHTNVYSARSQIELGFNLKAHPCKRPRHLMISFLFL